MPLPLSQKKTKKQKPVQDPDNFWMIQNKTSKLFSNGSNHPWFGCNGKIWHTHSSLMGHLVRITKRLAYRSTLYARNRPAGYVPQQDPHPYVDCQIVMYRRNIEAVADFVGYGE